MHGMGVETSTAMDASICWRRTAGGSSRPRSRVTRSGASMPQPMGTGGPQTSAYDVNGDGLERHHHGAVRPMSSGWRGTSRNCGEGSEIGFHEHTSGTMSRSTTFPAEFSKIDAIALVDMDGDGLKDLVTGSASGRTAGPAIRIERRGGALLVQARAPARQDCRLHPVSDRQRVWRRYQVVAGDINGEVSPISSSAKSEERSHLHQKKMVTHEEWQKAQPKRWRVNARARPRHNTPRLPSTRDERSGRSCPEARARLQNQAGGEPGGALVDKIALARGR